MFDTIFLEYWRALCYVTDFFDGDAVRIALFLLTIYAKIIMQMLKVFEKIVSGCFKMHDSTFSTVARAMVNNHNLISAYNAEGPITNKFMVFCKLFYDQTGEIQGVDFAKFKKIFNSSRLFCRFLHENKIISADFYERLGILYVALNDEEHEAIFGKICFMWDEIKKRHAEKNRPPEPPAQDEIELENLMQQINRGEI